MSHKIAEKLGVRYCGVQFGRFALYNDDHGCGGSFVVPRVHDEERVIRALEMKRAEFAKYKCGAR